MIRLFPVEFSVSAAGCITVSLMVLVLPIPWLIAVFLAAAVHESFHLICLKLYRIPVYRIRIGIHGAVIETAALTPAQELLCAAAGPVGSLLCILWVRIFPTLALCGLLQGAYNLLPVYPLDGGRILYSATELLIPRYAGVVRKVISGCTVMFMILTCLILFCKTCLPVFPVLGCYFLITAIHCRKTPCKGRQY